MKINYKNESLEKVIIIVNAIASTTAVFTFIALFGFSKPLIDANILYATQIVVFCFFFIEKLIRYFNAYPKTDFVKANLIQIPLLFIFAIIAISLSKWLFDVVYARHLAIGIYIFLQVVEKVCRTGVNLAASGKNPTKTLITSFVILIISGAGLLMLPMSSAGGKIGLTDALFTATSATCVTGLTVKDTGQDFSLVGQIIILSLIQLGGLGILIFGAVVAMLLRQALSVTESAAMQDILNERTLGRINKIIAFIFISTFLIEAIGAVALLKTWNNIPEKLTTVHGEIFCSIFHSISAFCNAGFGLFSDNLVSYSNSLGIYLVICPLIVVGGLGFSVLYNLFDIVVYKIKRSFKTRFVTKDRIFSEAPKMMRLQTKIVLITSFILIVAGAIAMALLGKYTGSDESQKITIWDAFFQSVSARTAGFNSINIGVMSEANLLVLIVLMFIGGSPGSTAGGIKTVTLVVIIMTMIASMRKRNEVELFKRTIKQIIVGRAITVVLFFSIILFVAIIAMCITENQNGFRLSQIAFEATSAIGTVGLSTGITPFLTAAGKYIIILLMLFGRLGPLTLVAALTFNLKTKRYKYPDESLVVG